MELTTSSLGEGRWCTSLCIGVDIQLAVREDRRQDAGISRIPHYVQHSGTRKTVERLNIAGYLWNKNLNQPMKT